MRTVPAVPSTVTSAPSGMRRVASWTEATHGMPSSLDTIMAWLPMAPTSTIDGRGGDEQRRPRRVGDRGDEHLAGLQIGGVRRVAARRGRRRWPRPVRWRRRAAPRPPDRGDLDGRALGPRAERWRHAVDHPRRLQLAELGVLGQPRVDAIDVGRGIGDEAVELGVEQHADVARLVEHTARHHPAARAPARRGGSRGWP